MRFKRWFVLPLLLAGAFAVGRSCSGAVPERRSGDRGPLPAGNAGATPAAVPAKTGDEAKQDAPRSAARPAAAEGTVVRVRDGDSIVVMRGGIGIEVRLDGIDCPELAQAFGRKAKSFTSELAFGKTVRLDGKGKDRYDRELAEVFLTDGRSLNRELVSAGYAWWYRKYSTDRRLQTLEQTARRGRRGLWVEPNPVPPWDFRVSNQQRPGGGR